MTWTCVRTSSRKKGFSRTSEAVSPCCSIPSGQSCERKTSICSPRFLSCAPPSRHGCMSRSGSETADQTPRAKAGQRRAHLEQASDVVFADVVHGPDRSVVKGNVLEMTCESRQGSSYQFSLTCGLSGDSEAKSRSDRLTLLPIAALPDAARACDAQPAVDEDRTGKPEEVNVGSEPAAVVAVGFSRKEVSARVVGLVRPSRTHHSHM